MTGDIQMAISDSDFLEMAHIAARSAKCISMRVGCLLVKDNRPLSSGVNGTPSGWKNCCDVHKERGPEHSAWSEKYEIHAEMNALLNAARIGIPVAGATAYVTHEPCFNCTKHLVAAGIKNICYGLEYYRETQQGRIDKIMFCSENDVNYFQCLTTF